MEVLSERFEQLNFKSQGSKDIQISEDYYDSFRYSSKEDEKDVILEKQLDIVPVTQYAEYNDFHPFIKSNRENVLAVTCLYKDQRENKEINIKLMGWYIIENQLKIR